MRQKRQVVVGGKRPGSETAARRHHSELRVAGAILGLWLALFAPQLIAGKVFVLGDAAAFRPFSEFSRQRWHALHERTFWNPFVFTGIAAAPSLADNRPQYLPDGLLNGWELATQRLPPLSAPLLAHLAGMLAIAWLARALWGAGVPAMIFAGMAWGLMPLLLVPLAFGHDAQITSASLIPVALLCANRLCAAKNWFGTAAAGLGLALTFAWQLMAGHPQVTVYSGLLLMALLVERTIHYRKPKALLLACLGVGLGLSMAAAVWWPAFLYNMDSVRGGEGVAAGEIANFSFAPRDLGSLVWPWAVGYGGATYWGGMRQTDYPPYLGIVTLLLAAMGIVSWRGRNRGLAWLMITSIVLAILHSLGSRLPVLQNALGHLPILSSFRVPITGLVLAALALVLLAAKGLNQAVDGYGLTRVRLTLLAGILAAALVLALILMIAQDPFIDFVVKTRPQLSEPSARIAVANSAVDLAWRTLVAAGVLGILAIMPRWEQRRRWLALAAIALMTIDMASISWPFLRSATGNLDRLTPPPAPLLATMGARDPKFRVATLDRSLFYSNAWIAWQSRSISGLHGAVIRSWDDLMRERLLGRPPILRAAAVRYIGGENLELTDTTDFSPLPGGGHVFVVRNALPRAYAVRQVVALDEKRVLSALASPQFDPSSVALVSDPAVQGTYEGADQHHIQWVVDDPDRLAIEVSSSRPTFLVIADTYCSGWNATVDGKPSTIHRVNHLWRGIALPEGRHTVAMTYVPDGWTRGVTITRAAGALWIGMALLLGGSTIIRRRGLRSRDKQPLLVTEEKR